MKVVALKCRDGGAIQYVQDLLRRCEAGEVVAVTAIEECRDEVAELVRDFNAAVALQAQIVERMERAASRVGIKAVAP